MEVHVKAHNFKPSPELLEYVQRRSTKLDRVNERVVEAKLELRHEQNRRDGERYVAQFTIATRGAILRAEDRATEARAAVDLVVDKMARQIKRMHDRKVHRGRRDALSLGQLAVSQLDAIEIEEPDTTEDGLIVRTKRFKIQPMDTAEAVEQLELLGHDFFVYYNPETSRMNVLYRRKDGGYGVIEPDIA
jgi:putative sigma-54 modulation protein